MPLLSLPNGLLFEISTKLEYQRDFNNLARTNRRLYSLLNDHLYKNNIRYHHGSALFWASRNGRISTAEKCLQMGANMELSDDGDTPLSVATTCQQPDMVKLLLECGANPNRPCIYDNFPLTIAARLGNEAMVGVMLDYGAELSH
ncbi:ankyrin repeat-containing domain protein [Aspergillus ambiguus]|uniref:ankyrin repeat-containing domain protein n=1 Tax=Aspergillus ambiguus TaxID=176160 RepID=UPI003CCD7B2B